jgi:hypothetical protein
MEQNVTSASSKPPDGLGVRRACPKQGMARTPAEEQATHKERRSEAGRTTGDAGRREARACAPERLNVPPANELEPNDREALQCLLTHCTSQGLS